VALASSPFGGAKAPLPLLNSLALIPMPKRLSISYSLGLIQTTKALQGTPIPAPAVISTASTSFIFPFLALSNKKVNEWITLIK
jgi:hypothetical protein